MKHVIRSTTLKYAPTAPDRLPFYGAHGFCTLFIGFQFARTLVCALTRATCHRATPTGDY